MFPFLFIALRLLVAMGDGKPNILTRISFVNAAARELSHLLPPFSMMYDCRRGGTHPAF